MNAKRKEFVDRLLRISELNQQLIDLDSKYKQPVYTRRIKLVQMGKAEVTLPQTSTPAANRNCKILVVQKATQRYSSLTQNRTNTNNSEDFRGELDQIQPKKSEIDNLESLLDRKRSVEQSNDNKKDDINFVSPINFALKQQMFMKDSIQRKKPYSATKNVVNSAKCIGFHQQETYDFQIISREKGINGKSIKINNFYSCDKQSKKQEQRKAKLLLMKQISKNYAKPFSPPPKITAKSYIVSEVTEQGIKVVVSFNSKNSQQVASLTKIMTCLIVIQLCQQENIDMNNEQVKIGKYESNIGGTTASLRPDQIYTIKQLLYGLMLPSGNDASLALAVWAGRRLTQIQASENKTSNETTQCSSATLMSPLSSKISKTTYYARFIRQMNQKAKELNMAKTKYVNSHGLSNQNNKSTAFDICLLCSYAIKNNVFKEIVNCRSYQGLIKLQLKPSSSNEESQQQQLLFNDQKFMEKRWINQKEQNSENLTQRMNYPSCKTIGVSRLNEMTVKWENTHKLLQNKPQEYLGIKTGMTPTAGPCLTSLIKAQNRLFLIIVLGCAKTSLRFKQTEILKRWLYKHQGFSRKLKKMKLESQSYKQEDSQVSDEQSKMDLD